MRTRNVINEYILSECNKIFNFWKLEEYFAPLDFPELRTIVKRDKKEFSFDAYYNGYGTRDLPLKQYKLHNEYLIGKKVPEDKLYNRANVYCGCYKIRTFVEKMAESCGLDMEKYAEISEMTGRFYIFSVQIDLDGKITDEGVQISPFFYAVLKMIQSKGVTANIEQKDIWKLNEDINEILEQNSTKIIQFVDIEIVKQILFDKLDINSCTEIGLEGASSQIYACKGLMCEEESGDFKSFYLDDIETVQKDYRNNKSVISYTTSLLRNSQQKTMIDSDIDEMKKWLSVDKFPLGKYPSRYSPSLMQQIAINIAISEKDRSEKVFSVNGPPGTGKTTLLKEIIASNVVELADTLIKYGLDCSEFVPSKVESASSSSYDEIYYTIPQEIAKYGILVVSNNNSAVENISLKLPRMEEVLKKETKTSYFDRTENKEIYFSSVADKFLGVEGKAWGLISARMGKKKYVSEVLDSCIFAKKNASPDMVTLDSAKEDSISWSEAKTKFEKTKRKVLALREEIRKDQAVLEELYLQKELLVQDRNKLKELNRNKEEMTVKLNEEKERLNRNEKKMRILQEEIDYKIKQASFIVRILIWLGWGKTAKEINNMRENINALVAKHEGVKQSCNKIQRIVKELSVECEKSNYQVISREEVVKKYQDDIYGRKNSLKEKYGNNLADADFYTDIKESRNSQNACPWTFDEYDKAREELFFAALQVRKAFVLESPYVRRNLFVYEAYNCGKYTLQEKKEMFPHLFNALAIVVPVISSTFASVGRFLKHAGSRSLGMLIVDEAGQAIPQSALGAIYRTKSAVVVGDPLQVEPVITIPQIVINMLAESTRVSDEYRSVENSVQIFADNINEFNGIIGERKVGCPLVVHRRCIEPMFSISNMISYENRMFNETLKKDNLSFLINKSGWINVEGPERGGKNHFVEKQAEKVCHLLERLLETDINLFKSSEKIFIITPFRTVAEDMRKYVLGYFGKLNFDKELLTKWVKYSIGTVHTFQGKEADEVLFVLGCSNYSIGAMKWVVKKANILNVACTRAKYRIAFVGNLADWKDQKYFREFIPRFVEEIEM